MKETKKENEGIVLLKWNQTGTLKQEYNPQIISLKLNIGYKTDQPF